MFEEKTPQIEPTTLLFYGVPKVGKTTLASLLPDSIIFDFEEGTNYITHPRVITVKKNKDLALFEQWYTNPEKNTFRAKFAIIDSLTAVEQMIDNTIVLSHNIDNPKEKIASAMDLAYGVGTASLRNKFLSLINYVKRFADRIIFIGHVKKKDLSSDKIARIINELDLTGKLASVIPSQIDAIAYMYRTGEELVMSFESNDDVIRGSRIKNIADKEIRSTNGMDIWKAIYPETLKEY